MTKIEQIDSLIQAENFNEESLKALAFYLYNIDADNDPSISVFRTKRGEFVIYEHGTKHPIIKGKGNIKNFKGLIFAATQGLPKGKVLDEKTRLYEIGAGKNVHIQSTAPARPKAAATANEVAKEKEKSTSSGSIKKGVWTDAHGCAVLNYFAVKTGVSDAAFLEKYGVFPISYGTFGNGKRMPNFTADNFAFSYIANDWIQKKQPLLTPEKGRNTTVKRGADNYIFGVAQLPASGENLFIFEGEDDAICANFHGFASVAIRGKGKALSDCVADDFKARFKSVFVVFDNEAGDAEKNEKTKESSKALAQKHGFIYVDATFLVNFFAAQTLKISGTDTSNIKDVCDAYKAGGAESGELYAGIFMQLCAGLNTRISGIKNDRFSVPIFHAISVPFNQYMADYKKEKNEDGTDDTITQILYNGVFEPLQVLALSLATEKRVCLQAAAGSGKSTALPAFIADYLFNKNSQANKLFFKADKQINQVIIAVPTLPLAGQLHKGFLNHDFFPLPNCELITGEFNAAQKRESSDAAVIICTYDSIPTAIITDKTLLITDEAHMLVTEKGYRDKATKTALKAIETAGYNLLLSATPNYLFNHIFGFKLVLADAQITNTKHVEICEYDGKETDLMPYIISCILDKRRQGVSGAFLIKLDNSTLLRAGAELANKAGLTSEIFSGQSDKYRRENANYNSILETSRLQTEVDIIFTTRLIEAGVSINNAIDTVYICDTDNNAKIIQQLARPRFDAATGANALVKAVIFIKGGAKGKEKSTFAETALEQYDKQANLAQKKADKLNNEANDFQNYTLETDAKDCIYQDENKACLVDKLALMFDIDNLSKTKDKELMAERLRYTDKTIKSIEFTTRTIREDLEFTAHKNDIKGQKEAALSAAVSALQSFASDKENLKYVLYKLVNTGKNKDVKKELFTVLGLATDKETTKAANEFYKTLPDATREIFANPDAKILPFLSKVADFARLPNTPLLDAINKADLADKAAFKALQDEINSLKLKARRARKRTGNINPYELNQCETANEIYQAFAQRIKNIKRGTSPAFSMPDLLKITNSILTRKDDKRSFKPKTASGTESVVAYLRTFFKVVPKRETTGSKETRYILTRL